MTLEQAIGKMNEMEKALYALGHAQAVLSVDGDTAAPKNSWKGRGKALAYLGELTYRQMVSRLQIRFLSILTQKNDRSTFFLKEMSVINLIATSSASAQRNKNHRLSKHGTFPD